MKSTFYRFIRRKIRRIARVLTILRVPIAILADLIAFMLSTVPGMPVGVANGLALVCAHYIFFAAAYSRVGAAAAAAECLHTSPLLLSVPAAPVFDVSLTVDYSMPELASCVLQSASILTISSVLLWRRAAQYTAQVILCFPVSSSLFGLSLFFGLL